MHDDRLYDEKELEKSWLISYSDLFTLLFVIILIVAAAHSAKLKTDMQEIKQEEARQQESLQKVHESLDLLNIQKLELQRQVHELEARRRSAGGCSRWRDRGDGAQAGRSGRYGGQE